MRGVRLPGVLSVALAVAALAPVTASAQRFAERTAVPQAGCRAGDRPETDLQGRVPRLTVGGAGLGSAALALGFQCNLDVVGRFPLPGAGTLESFGDCAYYGRLAGAGGTQVLDVSNPAAPVATAMLMTPAMLDPWESLRVNAKRNLLVADSNANDYLDIYDVSGDCRHPRLLSSTDMGPARGHEGWFAPDGLTYYMSRTGPDGAQTLFPIDISDPARPRRLASWAVESQTHGGFTTEDGRTSYVCQQQAPPKDALLVMDTSDIAARRPDPKPVVRTRIGLEDNQWCQSALRVTYEGRPFLIQYGERSGAADCSRAKDNWASFGYPRIFDIADDRAPRLVGTALLETALPQHCTEVVNEGAVNGLGYSVHHCSVDRLYDPTILACSWFFAGMRVLDIRDPARPVEIAYYNPGVGTVVGTSPRPVVRAERGEIWFANDLTGFYVVRLPKATWPFTGSARCPEFDDYYYAQYNPGSTCPTANLDGIGKPPPVGQPARVPARLTKLSVTTVRAGSRPRVRFVASRAATVTIDVRRGGRLVTRRRVTARPGRRVTVLRLPALRRGHYVVTARPAGGKATRRTLTVRR